MGIEVKGHSGCQIDVVSEGEQIYVYKSTTDSKYLKRLALQAEKQKQAAEIRHQHIRVPQIFDVKRTEMQTVIKMQYVYSRNFIEFFEQAGFEQVDYFINALETFIEYEISSSPLQKVSADVFQRKFDDINGKVRKKALFKDDSSINDIMNRCSNVFGKLHDMVIPIGTCHGDLTFSNILFNGNNYYLIDFLDSFIESPLQDIIKIRQDTAYRWSQLMYTKGYDSVRLHVVCDKMDQEIDKYFINKYQWYAENAPVVQLMNMLRILPYAHEERVIAYLKNVLNSLLDGQI
jgi:tRNA A-37 threonylcarbamoyl transferase component Bud32